ncbi:MAG: sigma-70 family RNA polymerase sigma factor [Verrucomicrobia bacterium]|nr:sigma-70 family RNA polymerase sigma factor [Verrucomicrobiota bacterium]
MNSLTDQQLLRDYVGKRAEAAFAELVRRHVDFVYSAALRMVRDVHLAEDVTQGVFVAFAQNARQLMERPVVSGWLHRTAQNLAAQTVRTDMRRRAREQEAAAMNELLATQSDPSLWEHIAPHLDAALGELNEADRDALLLRYFERKSAQEMAQTLGVSDEAAQKRVSRAVERLREFFAKRGITVGASGLVVVITANAVQAAPVGLATTIATAAALAGTAIATTSTATATATKAIAMTTLQKTIIAATLTAAIGTGIYEARRASSSQNQVQTFQKQQASPLEQIEQLTRKRDDVTRKLAALRNENERLNRNTAELLKLRGEVTRLKSDARASTQANATDTSTDAAAKSWLTRVNNLKQRLEQTPEATIPELQFITEQDWLNATKGKLETDTDYRKALSALRGAGENKFVTLLHPALKKYMEANNGKFPTVISQLQPYFESPVDEAILKRYAVVQADDLPNTKLGGDWIITQRAPVDEKYDSRWGIGPNGYGTSGTSSWSDESLALASAIKTLSAPLKTYKEANNGKEPIDPSQLQPYLTSSEQQQALQKLIQAAKVKSQSDAN